MLLLLAFTVGPSPQKFVAEGGSADLYAAFSVCPLASEIAVHAFFHYLNENIMEYHVIPNFNGTLDTGLAVTVDMKDIRQSVVVYISVEFINGSSNETVKISSNISHIYVRGKEYPIIIIMSIYLL